MQQDQQPKSPSGRGFPLKWTSLALLLLLMYAGCSMTTVKFSPTEDGDFSIGYLPVIIEDGDLVILDSYHRDYLVPGYSHRVSEVKNSFYSWTTNRLNLGKVTFLLFHIEHDVTPAPPGMPHLIRVTSRIVGPPRIFHPSPEDWEEFRRTGVLQFKPLLEYAEYETDREFDLCPVFS